MEVLTSACLPALQMGAFARLHAIGETLIEHAARVEGAQITSLERQKRREAESHPGRALIFCGPGNKGGDGFATARLLVQQGRRLDFAFFGYPGF